MEMVNIKINGMPLSVPNGISILEAARYAGIEIPTLCFLKDINEIGACRICMVEVKGARSLVTACVYPVNEGMEVFTNTEKVRNSRKITLELILSTHDRKCLSCVRSGSCELQQLCKEFGVDDETRYEGANPHYEFDDSAAHMIRDNNKCILCRRCVAACDMQKISVIGANAVASIRISAPPLIKIWRTSPAYPAGSVLSTARPARWWKRTTATRCLPPSTIRRNT